MLGKIGCFWGAGWWWYEKWYLEFQKHNLILLPSQVQSEHLIIGNVPIYCHMHRNSTWILPKGIFPHEISPEIKFLGLLPPCPTLLRHCTLLLSCSPPTPPPLSHLGDYTEMTFLGKESDTLYQYSVLFIFSAAVINVGKHTVWCCYKGTGRTQYWLGRTRRLLNACVSFSWRIPYCIEHWCVVLSGTEGGLSDINFLYEDNCICLEGHRQAQLNMEFCWLPSLVFFFALEFLESFLLGYLWCEDWCRD